MASQMTSQMSSTATARGPRGGGGVVHSLDTVGHVAREPLGEKRSKSCPNPEHRGAAPIRVEPGRQRQRDPPQHDEAAGAGAPAHLDHPGPRVLGEVELATPSPAATTTTTTITRSESEGGCEGCCDVDVVELGLVRAERRRTELERRGLLVAWRSAGRGSGCLTTGVGRNIGAHGSIHIGQAWPPGRG